jgi:hypothetical protein
MQTSSAVRREWDFMVSVYSDACRIQRNFGNVPAGYYRNYLVKRALARHSPDSWHTAEPAALFRMPTAASLTPSARQIPVNALVDYSAGHAAEMLPELTVCGLCAGLMA